MHYERNIKIKIKKIRLRKKRNSQIMHFPTFYHSPRSIHGPVNHFRTTTHHPPIAIINSQKNEREREEIYHTHLPPTATAIPTHLFTPYLDAGKFLLYPHPHQPLPRLLPSHNPTERAATYLFNSTPFTLLISAFTFATGSSLSFSFPPAPPPYPPYGLV